MCSFPPALCPKGWTPNVDSTTCYIFNQHSVSNPKAQQLCEDQGGFLADIYTQREHDFLSGNKFRNKKTEGGGDF